MSWLLTQPALLLKVVVVFTCSACGCLIIVLRSGLSGVVGMLPARAYPAARIIFPIPIAAANASSSLSDVRKSAASLESLG